MGRRAVALLLSGGGGTRLWPLSTDAQPKQFLKLIGERSLYQHTLKRLAAAGISDVIVLANAAHEVQVREQAQELGLPAPAMVLEPMRRDSAAAIAAGVAAILARYPHDTVIAALPCDHLIPDEAHFARALAEGEALAALGFLGTFGIRPLSPSTEFGYIQRGGRIEGHGNAFHVARFHEKPKLDRAAAYLADGGFDWNSGMFIFRADTFAAEAEKLMPEIWRAAGDAVTKAQKSGGPLHLHAPSFERALRTSIDYALFEKSDRVGVVPVSFAWSDVGNWASVHGAHAQDATGNATVGQASILDGSGNLVIGDGIKTVVIGVHDLVVIASPEGVLVAPRARAAEIKAAIEATQRGNGTS